VQTPQLVLDEVELSPEGRILRAREVTKTSNRAKCSVKVFYITHKREGLRADVFSSPTLWRAREALNS
jgi:hypothetical protein